MKRVLLTLLAIIVALGLFAAVGYSGYRLGYAQAARGGQRIANGDTPRPAMRPFDNFGPREMPRGDFERGVQRGFGRDRFPMMGFGFFAPLFWIGRLLVLALIVWFVYWLFTRSGWRLTRETVTTTATPTRTETVTETKTENE
jgi:hypothetical protein